MRTAKVWRRVAILATLVLLLGSTSQSQGSDYGPNKTAYDDYIKRPSLQMRSRGRIKLCATGDLRALQIMADSYGQKWTPIDQERYLITSIAAQYFGADDSVEIWKKWREKFAKPEDAWLWYRSLIVHQGSKGDDELIATLNDVKGKDMWIRAAALEALAECNSDKILPLLDTFIDEVRKMKDIQRTVFTESCIRALYARAYNLGTDEFRKPAMKLIEMIDEKETAPRTKLVIARYLRAILGGDKLYIQTKPWAWMLLNPGKGLPQGSDGKDGRYAEPPKPKFVGLEAAGSRIAYVIDLSDSMCTPMTVKEKEEIKKPPPPKRGPITGGDEPGRQGSDGEPEKPKEEPKEPEKKKELDDDIDWSKVKNRFDCAREYLKLSLKGLQPSQFYCVIMFGSAAEFAKTTKCLMPASPQNIANTIRELDSIKPGSPTDMRKYGTLRGDTNLHGGLHRAWKVRTNGVAKEYEYVDASTFPDGADTVFLLSDGDPTDDDWAVVDKRDKDDQTGDPESRTKLPDQEQLRFPGPYGYRYESIYLPDDIRRINLFRKAEIHCIGIGEVSGGLLTNIARWALDGDVKMVGK